MLLLPSLHTVFDDGDERTLKRSSLVLKGGRHYHESEVCVCMYVRYKDICVSKVCVCMYSTWTCVNKVCVCMCSTWTCVRVRFVFACTAHGRVRVRFVFACTVHIRTYVRVRFVFARTLMYVRVYC